MSHQQSQAPDAPYFQSHDDDAKYANQALARLRAEGLSPLPKNFELWFAYYAQSHVDVVRALDTLMAQKQPITNAQCEGIHQLFLSEEKRSDSVREAGIRIEATITGVSKKVDIARSATQQFNEALKAASKKLDIPSTSPKIHFALGELLVNTRQMMEHNQELEDALVQSYSAMQALGRDLEAVRKQAVTDGLTSLANRQAFDTELARLCQSVAQGQAPFSLLLFDIDHFKQFNDTYGHPVGDEVLRLVARTLGQCVRSTDLAARYGGEEFAILLPNTDLTAALELADALRSKIESMSLVRRKGGDKLGRVTVSGGAAQSLARDNPGPLLARADAALYQAKALGRNRVELDPTSLSG